MKENGVKGVEREREMPREYYYSSQYFQLPQLFSFALQIHHIGNMAPHNVLEVGPGNGFVTSFLRSAGIQVTTVDINPGLNPDICAPIEHMNDHLEDRFDLVVCCEVLEHMPLESLEANLDSLRRAGERLFMTLPNAYATAGAALLMRVPRLWTGILDLNMSLPYKHRLQESPHYWEVGSNRACTKSAIRKQLQRRYNRVETGRFPLNPYHLFFMGQ